MTEVAPQPGLHLRTLSLTGGMPDALAREKAETRFAQLEPAKTFTRYRGGVRTSCVNNNPQLAAQASRFGYLNLSSTRGEETAVAEGQ